MIQTNQGFSSMMLRFQTGVDANGKPTYKDKSYSRVLPAVTQDDLYAVGDALGSLSTWTLTGVSRVDRSALTSQ